MKTKQPNFFKKLKAKAILFLYSIPYTRFSKTLEIERLQILSGIKNIEDCKYSKKKQHALKVLKRPMNDMSITRIDTSKDMSLKKLAEEANKKIEALRKEIDEEAARRKEEEEIEAAYLEYKHNQQRLELRQQFIEQKSDPKEKSKPKVKKQNEKSTNEPKKKSITKDKSSTPRKKVKKD